jgi:hypothetical protein
MMGMTVRLGGVGWQGGQGGTSMIVRSGRQE